MIKAIRSAGALLVGFLLLMVAGLLRADPAEATITSPSSAITVATTQVINFTATSTDSLGRDSYYVTSYSWDFGDGTSGSGVSTTHAYSSPGAFTATLTVSFSYRICKSYDYDGNCLSWANKAVYATATRTITVIAPPTINSFSASSTTVGTGKPVTLSWSVSGADSLSVSSVGSVTGTSIVVYPASTTTYTLVAQNWAGSRSSSVTVTIYTVGVSITPGSAGLKFGETRSFSATVTPANQGVSWSATGGLLSGSSATDTLFTGTASGPFTVKATSIEDGTKSAIATGVVATVTIGTPVPNPSSGQTFVGGAITLSAVVSNAIDSTVAWSVNGGGTINSAGVFTASAQGTYVVTAKSVADPTKSATTTIAVVPVIVTVTPNSTTVSGGSTKQFSAAVTGSGAPNQSVTWSVVSAGGGTITPNGLYTAPATPGDYVVRAISSQDPSCYGNAMVHVPGWVLRWRKDIVYVGTKEVTEVDAQGVHVILVDHLGSPRFLVGPTGLVESEQKFLPFGEQLADPVSVAKFTKGFTNHEQTDPSGLIYMQARFYAPMYGRFLSPDPARDQHFEETQSWNIYSYVRNQPTMLMDPNGQQAVPHQETQWKIEGMRRAGMTEPQIREALRAEAGRGVVLAGAGLTLGAASELGAGAALMNAGRSGLGWLTTTGAALWNGAKDLMSRGSQALQTEQSVSDKLSRYLLNPDHPVGGSKAEWFKQALGFTKDNMADLAKQIKFDPSTATQTGVTEFGTKFNQTISITGANGKTIDMTFAWIKNKDGVVRLVTAIPEKLKEVAK
ncbi:RHS repeat-associated core domain-containing protein [Geothrix terrae]|uniref:RHS repeat-associated core domain-containing protein n=1 Tax=Geothrix terrae TaxID=2922720 RepID=UPI001FAE5590